MTGRRRCAFYNLYQIQIVQHQQNRKIIDSVEILLTVKTPSSTDLAYRESGSSMF